jgi:uncharacterized protein YigE (DUF2233 family)
LIQLILGLLALLIMPFCASANDGTSSGWRIIDEDLEIKELGDGSLFSTGLVFVRSALKSYKISVIPASDFGMSVASAQTIAKLSRSQVAINANFFDPELKALGLVTSRGINRSKLHKGGRVLTGIFQISQAGPSIVSRDGYVASGALEALQAGPRLLASGSYIEGLAAKDVATRRAGVCIDSQRRVVLYTSTSNLGGISLLNLQKILAADGINCIDALNLDGGGSAQLYIGEIDINKPLGFEKFLPGMDEVPVFLALKRTE